MDVLVVEDDPEMSGALRRGLAYEGFTVEVASSGEEALQKVSSKPVDIIILDVMLPGMDGIEVCHYLRKTGDTPILMLTAKGTVPDRVKGLSSGADDYLTKPFAFDELLARLQALLRRARPTKGDLLEFADLTLDVKKRELKRGDAYIPLTTQEFDLLEVFMRHPQQVLPKSALYENAWGYEFEGESNVLDVYVSYLRSKLEADDHPRLIHTVRGFGYVLRE